MFQILKSQTGKNKLLQINSECNTTKAKICLNHGGNLEQLIFNGNEIITGLTHLPYNQTYASSILFPFANRVKDGKYRFMSKNYFLECNETKAQNALHGLVFNKKFVLVHENTTKKSASVKLSYSETEPHPGFPFLFTIDLIYKISTNKIKLKIEISNTDKKSFPFTIGWHPYFKIFDKKKSLLSFKSLKKLESDVRNITKGIKNIETPNPLALADINLDDAFVLNKNEVTFETLNYQVKLTLSESSKYLQLYTPKDFNAIAIEPMTGVSDSFNNGIGLRKLNSGEKFNIEWSINISKK